MGKPGQKCTGTQSEIRPAGVQRNHERGAAKYLKDRRELFESLEVQNLTLTKDVISLRSKLELFKGAVEELLNSNDLHSSHCREDTVQFIIKTELSPDHQSPSSDDEQMNDSPYTNNHHDHPSVVKQSVSAVMEENAYSAAVSSSSQDIDFFSKQQKEDMVGRQTFSKEPATNHSCLVSSYSSSWHKPTAYSINNTYDMIVGNESRNQDNASLSNCHSLSTQNLDEITPQASQPIGTGTNAQPYGPEVNDTFVIPYLGDADDLMYTGCSSTALCDVKMEPGPFEEIQFTSQTVQSCQILPDPYSQALSMLLPEIKDEPCEPVLKSEPTLKEFGIKDAQDPTQANRQGYCGNRPLSKKDQAIQSILSDLKAPDQDWFKPEMRYSRELSMSNSSEPSPNSVLSPNSVASPDSTWLSNTVDLGQQRLYSESPEKNSPGSYTASSVYLSNSDIVDLGRKRMYSTSPEKSTQWLNRTTGGRPPRRLVALEKQVIENEKDVCSLSSRTEFGGTVIDEKDMGPAGKASGHHMPENDGTKTENLKQAAVAGDELNKTADKTPTEPTAEDETFKEHNDNISKCSCIKNSRTRTNHVASDPHTKMTPEGMLPEKPATSQSHEPAKTEHPDSANSPDKNNTVDNNPREDGVESSKHSDPQSLKIPPDGEETVVTKEDTEKSLESSENKLISVLVHPEADVPETRHKLLTDVAEIVHADNLSAHTILSKTSQAPSPASCAEDDTTKTLPSLDSPRPASPKPDPVHSCSTDSNNKSPGTSAGGTDEKPSVDKSNPSPKKDAATQTVSTSIINSEADEKPSGTHSVILSQAADTKESRKLDAADSLKDHATEVTPIPSLSSNDRDEQTSDVDDEQTSTEVSGPGMNVLQDSCKQVVQESFAKLTIEDGESSDPARSLSEKLKGMAL